MFEVRVCFAEEMFALSTLTYFTRENNESSVRFFFLPLFVFPRLSKQAHPTDNSDKPCYHDGDLMVRGCTASVFVCILLPWRAPGQVFTACLKALC